jgi:hypothetical protein
MLNIIQIFMPGRGQLVTPKVGEGDQIYRYAIISVPILVPQRQLVTEAATFT